MTVRHYDPATDADDVSSWWRHRHGVNMPLAVLPPIGLVALNDRGQRLAAVWLYLSAGIGVCFVENPVSLPGLGLPVVTEAFNLLMDHLEAIARTHDYGVMTCHTSPAIARMLKKRGFLFAENPVITGEKYLNAATPP